MNLKHKVSSAPPMPMEKEFPKIPKALYWYKTAAKNGNVNAMKELGSIYAEGDLGVQKDIQEAKRCNDIARKAEQKK